MQPPAQKGVRRTAEQQPLFTCQPGQLPPLVKGRCKRLFRINMLTRLERREVVLEMRLRGGQVQDQVDLRVGNHLVAGRVCLRDTVLRSLPPRLFQPAGCARDDLHHIIFF